MKYKLLLFVLCLMLFPVSVNASPPAACPGCLESYTSYFDCNDTSSSFSLKDHTVYGLNPSTGLYEFWQCGFLEWKFKHDLKCSMCTYSESDYGTHAHEETHHIFMGCPRVVYLCNY